MTGSKPGQDQRTNGGGSASLTLPAAARRFDGVVCFGGEDWWYHNRGHYDMQMMRELSRTVPVLYVNSIGMRVPRPAEGAMFVRRVARKLRSIRRALVRVDGGFWVMSPIVVPGRLGLLLTRRMLAAQIRRAARRIGIARPLVWVACPPGVEAMAALRPVGVVYQRTDRFESFSGVDPDRIRGYDRALKARADLTLFCSRLLHEAEAPSCAHALYVDHGVDFDRFRGAAERGMEPADVAPIPRPRVGFVGGIDAHTFDPPLLVETARRLPEAQFVLVGACSLPEGWCQLPNVHLLGQRPYTEVAAYMAACDVLIMPWNKSEWIRACNPVKLKEYLAVGRPVVSTPFAELASYRDHVAVAEGPEAFARAIRAALANQGDARARRARVQHDTWQEKAAAVRVALESLGLCLDDPMPPASGSYN